MSCFLPLHCLSFWWYTPGKLWQEKKKKENNVNNSLPLFDIACRQAVSFLRQRSVKATGLGQVSRVSFVSYIWTSKWYNVLEGVCRAGLNGSNSAQDPAHIFCSHVGELLWTTRSKDWISLWYESRLSVFLEHLFWFSDTPLQSSLDAPELLCDVDYNTVNRDDQESHFKSVLLT